MIEQYELISYKDRSIRVVIDSVEYNDGWFLCAITDSKTGENLSDWYSVYEQSKILDAAIEQNKLVNQD